MEPSSNHSNSDSDGSPNGASSKLDKGTDRYKKQHSYTYWVQNNKELFPQHENKELIAPKKIEDPDLLKLLENTSQKTQGVSAWNMAGTWEDKKLKIDVVKQFFQKYLIESEWQCKHDELKATEIDTLTGEANIILSRGKKRIGYELEIKVKFIGQGKFDGAECAIELKELCDDGSDPECRVYVTEEKSKGQGVKLKAEIQSQKVLHQFIEKCKEVLNIIKDEI